MAYMYLLCSFFHTQETCRVLSALFTEMFNKPVVGAREDGISTSARDKTHEEDLGQGAYVMSGRGPGAGTKVDICAHTIWLFIYVEDESRVLGDVVVS